MAKATIKDVAKYANVSIGTVSHVINHEGSVKEATKQKVMDAISALGYIPNASARSLRSEKSNVIGLVVSDISNIHFTYMAKVIEDALQKEDFSLVICSTDDDPAQELRHLQRLREMRVDGIIINTTGGNDAYIVQLSHILPIVLIERKICNPRLRGDLVTSNNYDGVYTMTQLLIDSGHKRIGIINADLQVSTGKERFAGFQAAMSGVGISVDENYRYRYDCHIFRMESGMAGCKALMSLTPPPTAIVVTNNTLAIGVYKYLRQSNFSVPDDVSVLSYGNIANDDLFYVRPGYTTLNPAFIGEKAASCLLSRIKNSETQNREIIFEPLLIRNNSVKEID